MSSHNVYCFRLRLDEFTGEPIVIFYAKYSNCQQIFKREISILSEKEFKEWKRDIGKKSVGAAKYFADWYWFSKSKLGDSIENEYDDRKLKEYYNVITFIEDLNN